MEDCTVTAPLASIAFKRVNIPAIDKLQWSQDLVMDVLNTNQRLSLVTKSADTINKIIMNVFLKININHSLLPQLSIWFTQPNYTTILRNVIKRMGSAQTATSNQVDANLQALLSEANEDVVNAWDTVFDGNAKVQYSQLADIYEGITTLNVVGPRSAYIKSMGPGTYKLKDETISGYKFTFVKGLLVQINGQAVKDQAFMQLDDESEEAIKQALTDCTDTDIVFNSVRICRPLVLPTLNLSTGKITPFDADFSYCTWGVVDSGFVDGSGVVRVYLKSFGAISPAKLFRFSTDE